MKKIIISLAVMLGVSALPAMSAGDSLDVNSDGRVDCFDLVLARQNNTTSEELTAINDFILGRETNSNPEYAVDESCILEPKGTIHTGDGTFYGGGYESGCAMLDPVSKDYWIVAMNLPDYNNAQLAGAYIEVTGELGTINMLVTDLLPEGKKGDLDLYTDAFPLIAPVEKGRVPVSWKIIPLDSAENDPVSYKYKEGTTEYWCGIQVRNHRYPVTRLEYLDENGEFIEIERKQYNYFESDKMGKGPFTFRITDIYGQMIIDENIPLSYDDTEIIQGNVQFPE
ncbi:MAG: hypothetical protein NC177_00070 [Ruminococcus flavefaciens]|nr:hypothetical protein [Ruminococcus flavefaciens]